MWFEDSKRWYEEEAKNVKKMVKAHFLIPEIEWHSGEKPPKDYSYSNSYDLILVDYQLDSNHGDELIRQIRANQIVTDVLFYSANIHDLLGSISDEENYLDGVYVSDRDRAEFEIKVESLINKLVRRSADIVNLRGFVLDSTSDFESRVEDMLDQYWEKANEEQRSLLRKKLGKVYGDKQGGLIRKKSEVDDSESFQFKNHNREHGVLGIQDRMRMLNACKEILDGIDLGDSENIVKYYNDKVNSFRIELGHIPCDGETITVRGTTWSIGDKLFRHLRSNVKDVDDMLEYIENNLDGFNGEAQS